MPFSHFLYGPYPPFYFSLYFLMSNCIGNLRCLSFFFSSQCFSELPVFSLLWKLPHYCFQRFNSKNTGFTRGETAVYTSWPPGEENFFRHESFITVDLSKLHTHVWVHYTFSCDIIMDSSRFASPLLSKAGVQLSQKYFWVSSLMFLPLLWVVHWEFFSVFPCLLLSPSLWLPKSLKLHFMEYVSTDACLAVQKSHCSRCHTFLHLPCCLTWIQCKTEIEKGV